MTRLGSQGKEFPMMNLNETTARHGFCVDRVRESEELHGQMVEMHHKKTGAQLVWVDNGEVNKTFCVAFKTLPEDSTGDSTFWSIPSSAAAPSIPFVNRSSS